MQGQRAYLCYAAVRGDRPEETDWVKDWEAKHPDRLAGTRFLVAELYRLPDDSLPSCCTTQFYHSQVQRALEHIQDIR